MMRTGAIAPLALAAALLAAWPCRAQTDANLTKPIEPFLDGGAWAVVCSDMDRWTAIGNDDALMDLMKIKHPLQEASRRRLAGMLQAAIPELRRMGVHRGWMVLSLDDVLVRGGAPLIFPIDDDGDRDEALRMAKNIAITSGVVRNELGRQEATHDAAVCLEDLGVVLSGSEQVVEYYSQLAPEARPDLVEPLEELMAGGAITAAVLSPGRDMRRAVSEMWPEDPPIFESLTGAMLADDVRWVGIELRHEPRAVARVIVVLRDEATAKRFDLWLNQKLEWLATQTPPEMPAGDPTLRRTAEALRPRREGSRIVLELDPSGEQINAIRAVVTPLVEAARAAANKNG